MQEELRYATEFFGVDIQGATNKLARELDELQISYALLSGIAPKMTPVVHVLLTREGLDTFKSHHLKTSYTEKFPGSRGVRDTEHNIAIDITFAGEVASDRLAFPDPAGVTQAIEGLQVLPLELYIELKLASGMTELHRIGDLADVLELIQIRTLPREFAESLDPSVRAKYAELWEAAQQPDYVQ